MTLIYNKVSYKRIAASNKRLSGSWQSMLALIIQHGEEVKSTWSCGKIRVANNSEPIKLLLKNMTAEDLGKQDDHGFLLLDYAIEKGSAEIIKLLIEHMDPEDLGKQDDNGKTFLSRALLEQNLPLSKLLIEQMNPEDLGKTIGLNKDRNYLHLAKELDLSSLIMGRILRASFQGALCVSDPI